MTRLTRVAPMLVLAAGLAPSLASAAATYSFTDMGTIPGYSSVIGSEIYYYAARRTIDDQGGLRISGMPTPIDRIVPGFPQVAIDAPFVPLDGRLYDEVPGTDYRVGYVAGPNLWDRWRAFAWNQATGSGKVLDSSLDANTFSLAIDVNRSGQVVGYTGSDTGGVSTSHPLAISLNDPTWNPFAALPADALGQHSEAYGLNDIGDIVGQFKANSLLGYATDSDQPHAFLLSKGELLDLNDLVHLEPGWLLESATDIDNSGRIVGVARDPNDSFHNFMLTPSGLPIPDPTPDPVPAPVPEPTPLLIFAAGFLIVRCRLPRK